MERQWTGGRTDGKHYALAIYYWRRHYKYTLLHYVPRQLSDNDRNRTGERQAGWRHRVVASELLKAEVWNLVTSWVTSTR